MYLSFHLPPPPARVSLKREDWLSTLATLLFLADNSLAFWGGHPGQLLRDRMPLSRILIVSVWHPPCLPSRSPDGLPFPFLHFPPVPMSLAALFSQTLPLTPILKGKRVLNFFCIPSTSQPTPLNTHANNRSPKFQWPSQLLIISSIRDAQRFTRREHSFPHSCREHHQ